MKQRFCSAVFRSLAWTLVFASGWASESASLEESSPASPSPSSLATGGLTIEEAISIALESNPDLRASSGRIEAAAGRAYQAGLWSNPELTLSAEDWPVSGGDGFSDSKQTVGVAQTIPFPGKKSLDHRIGVAGVRLSESESRLRRLELVRDVKIAFYQVLTAERLVEVERELVKVADSLAITARKRVTAGAAADQEQLRAEIPLAQAKVELSGLERELVAARETLALLLGRPELNTAHLSGALNESPSLALLNLSPEQWLPTHPAVVATESSRERARMEWRRARLEPYPDVTMEVAGGRIGETGDSIIQMAVSIPLPIIDRSKGRKQEAQANLRVAEASQTAAEQRLLRAWATTRKRFRTAVEQVTNYREQILPKANDALRLVQTGFEEGKFGFIDLLDTQRTAAEARLVYQQKLLELNIAQAELESLVIANATPTTPRQSPAIRNKN